MKKPNKNLIEYKRLTDSFFEAVGNPATMPPSTAYVGGQADLTPLRNKAREGLEALAEAQRAADQGRVDDCLEQFRRAKACIDAALGGQIGPFSSPGNGSSFSSTGR